MKTIWNRAFVLHTLVGYWDARSSKLPRCIEDFFFLRWRTSPNHFSCQILRFAPIIGVVNIDFKSFLTMPYHLIGVFHMCWRTRVSCKVSVIWNFSIIWLFSVTFYSNIPITVTATNLRTLFFAIDLIIWLEKCKWDSLPRTVGELKVWNRFCPNKPIWRIIYWTRVAPCKRLVFYGSSYVNCRRKCG